MTEFAKTPLEIALAVVYAILLVQQKSNRSLLTAAAFVAISLTIRLSIDVSAVRDFRPYFDSFQQVKYGLPAPELAGEPYRYLLFRAALLFGDLPDRLQIDGIYYFHFFVVTAFFLWLAYLRDVGFEIKLILFWRSIPSLPLSGSVRAWPVWSQGCCSTRSTLESGAYCISRCRCFTPARLPSCSL